MASKYQVVVMRVKLKKNVTITVANIYIPGSFELEQAEMCSI